MIIANFCKKMELTLAYLQWFLQHQCCAHNLSPDVIRSCYTSSIVCVFCFHFVVALLFVFLFCFCLPCCTCSIVCVCDCQVVRVEAAGKSWKSRASLPLPKRGICICCQESRNWQRGKSSGAPACFWRISSERMRRGMGRGWDWVA